MKQAELAVKMQALADETEANDAKSRRDKLLAYKAAADTWDKVSPYVCPKKVAVKVEHNINQVSIKDALDAALVHAEKTIEGEVVRNDEPLNLEDVGAGVAALADDVAEGIIVGEPEGGGGGN